MSEFLKVTCSFDICRDLAFMPFAKCVPYSTGFSLQPVSLYFTGEETKLHTDSRVGQDCDPLFSKKLDFLMNLARAG